MLDKKKIPLAASMVFTLLGLTATSVAALDLDFETVRTFYCGPGANAELVPLQNNADRFGIARTNFALKGTVGANQSSTVDYFTSIALSRGDVKALKLYYKIVGDSPNTAPLANIFATVDYTFRVNGKIRTNVYQARLQSSSSGGVEGWRSVTISIGGEPIQVGELKIHVLLRSDPSRVQTVKFGKAEVISSTLIRYRYPSGFIELPQSCGPGTGLQ